MLTVEQLKASLNLTLLSAEGGYYAETYRAQEQIPAGALPARYQAGRSLGTAIYYLLTPDTFSAMHRLLTDEVYHFYLGDPVEMLQLRPDGSGQVVRLGQDILGGMCLQTVVPRGVWQGSRLAAGGQFALLGTTMAPGFDPADFELGQREALIGDYADFADWIAALTNK